MKAKVNNELLYFDVLKRITRYQTVERMRRKSESDWGLPFEETLEMAYENVITEAKNAIHGKRRPKTKCKFAIDTCDGPDGKSGFICNGCAEMRDERGSQGGSHTK